jgi:hypothetical protein
LAAIDDLDAPRGRRRFRLTSVRGCRRELAAVYHEARNKAGLDWSDAARVASILQILARMIEGSDFEARLTAIETALAEQNGRPVKANGSGRYVGARP